MKSPETRRLVAVGLFLGAFGAATAWVDADVRNLERFKVPLELENGMSLRWRLELFRGDAEARGGIYKEGLAPEDVHARLAELGVATPQGRILDPVGYRDLLRQGVEGVQAELLVSTSQMVAIVTFTIAAILYQRLRARSGPGIAV